MSYYTRMPSPVGPLLLASDGHALTGLYMSEHSYDPKVAGLESIGQDASATWQYSDEVQPFGETKAQLTAYFEGTLTEFDLPLSLDGTDFQRRVWTALLAIPYGTTTSYGALAQQLGNPGGARAVGLANGRNPISIIVPCHRVIGSNGKLTGYGGGLPRKAALLDFEFSVRLNGPCAFSIMAGESHTLSLAPSP